MLVNLEESAFTNEVARCQRGAMTRALDARDASTRNVSRSMEACLTVSATRTPRGSLEMRAGVENSVTTCDATPWRWSRPSGDETDPSAQHASQSSSEYPWGHPRRPFR